MFKILEEKLEQMEKHGITIPKPEITIDLDVSGPITFMKIDGKIRMVKSDGEIIPYVLEENVSIHFKGSVK